MAKVEIIATPPGQAPDWVRDAWVGLSLPVDPNPVGPRQIGVLGGKAENLGGYHVHTQEALKILAEKNEAAAQWWLDHLPIMPPWLVFSKSVCKFTE